MFIAEYRINVTFHTSEWGNIHLMNVSNHHEKINVIIAELNNSSDWKWGLGGLCCVFATFPFVFWKWSPQNFRWSAVESAEETLEWQGILLAVPGISRSVLHSQHSHKYLFLLSFHISQSPKCFHFEDNSTQNEQHNSREGGQLQR